jgi:dihydroorotase
MPRGTAPLTSRPAARTEARAIGGARVGSLVQVLNELLALGLPLPEVVRMVTANAAALLGLEGEIGTLTPGAAGDVSVLALDRGEWTLADSLGVELRATVRLRPELTVRGGRVHRADSPLLLEPAQPAA